MRHNHDVTFVSSHWLLSPTRGDRDSAADVILGGASERRVGGSGTNAPKRALMDSQDDDQLVRLAIAGSIEALRPLYERLSPSIMRFVHDMLRDRTLAADAHQDTFIRVFQRIHTLEDSRKFVAWVFGIARRICLEQRRALGRREIPVEEPDDLPQSYDDTNPESLVLSAESMELVERAIARLSSDRRAILLLRCDHGLSYDEIAEAMNCSVAKVKVELHRARATLRGVLDGSSAVDSSVSTLVGEGV